MHKLQQKFVVLRQEPHAERRNSSTAENFVEDPTSTVIQKKPKGIRAPECENECPKASSQGVASLKRRPSGSSATRSIQSRSRSASSMRGPFALIFLAKR